MPDMLDECFPDGNSMLARFYRWVKKLQQQCDIEEEKLIVTIVIGLVMNGPLIICDFIAIHA